MKRPFFCLLTVVSFFLFSSKLNAQGSDSLLQQADLHACVEYALKNQPVIKQSLIDEEITEKMIKGRLADWYPQISFDYSLQHYFKLQTSVFNGNRVSFGVKNTSLATFSLTQNIFDRDVLLASQSAKDVRRQSEQTTTSNKINIVVEVSKAFYDVLLSQLQIRLADSDIVILQKSLDIAVDQYKAGIVDKVDYKRATITLNNAKAQQRAFKEQIKGKYAYLKELMNYPANEELHLYFDSTQVREEAFIDTTQTVNYQNRIEYQLLQTQKRLQDDNLRYYKWAFIPSLSAFGYYNLNYLNNDFGKLYSREFPTSFVGLAVSFPIFQGFKRGAQIRSAQLSLDRLQYNFQSLRDSILTEYTQAVSVYKAALSFFQVQEENLELAKDVYNITDLQYKSGVKTYLEVIVAESNLRTTQVNYLNALYALLSSKLDAEKALGTLTY